MEKRPRKDEVKFSNTSHNSNQYLHQYLIYLCQEEQLQQEGVRSSLLMCRVPQPSHTGWQMMVSIPSLSGLISQKFGYQGDRMAPPLAPAQKEHLNLSVNLTPDP